MSPCPKLDEPPLALAQPAPDVPLSSTEVAVSVAAAIESGLLAEIVDDRDGKEDDANGDEHDDADDPTPPTGVPDAVLLDESRTS